MNHFLTRLRQCFFPNYGDDPGSWRRYEETADLYEGDA